jgi:hypothetical protein
MAKKKQNIQLEGLENINFKTEPDVKAAQSVVKPKEEKPPVKAATPKPTPSKKKEEAIAPKKVGKGTFPPRNKKRASFNIDEDLHKALKDYSYFEEIEMVEYIFEHLVRPDLTKKGFYPPKKKKR